MTDANFDEIMDRALRLSPVEQARLLERLAASMRAVLDVSTDAESGDYWDEGELAELLRIEPLPPAEVAAQGLLGTWADLGIQDGPEWVNAQKRRRKERSKW